MSASTSLAPLPGVTEPARPPVIPPAAGLDDLLTSTAIARVPADDPDAIERAAALADVAAEEKGAAAPAAPAPPAAPAAAEPAPAAEPQPGAVKPGPAPYDRFAEVAARTKKAEEAAAYWRGVAEARGIKPGPPPAPAANDKPEPATPEERAAVAGKLINGAQQHILDAGGKFDQGEGNFVDFLGNMFAGLGRVFDVREQMLAESLTAQITKLVNDTVTKAIAQYQGAADALVKEQQLRDLKAKHPYLAAMTDPQLATLANMAKAEALALGRPIGTTQPDTLRLRQHIAELTDIYGPRWHPKFVPATPAATAAQPAPAQPPQPAQPATPAASAPGVEAVTRKAGLAAAQPPSAATAAGASDRQVTTIDDIDKLTDEEVEALPAATRKRLLAS